MGVGQVSEMERCLVRGTYIRMYVQHTCSYIHISVQLGIALVKEMPSAGCLYKEV